MSRKIALILIILSAVLISRSQKAWAGNAEKSDLCAAGIDFYQKGDDQKALREFYEVLALDPTNTTAHQYINTIFKKELVKAQPSRAQIIDRTLSEYSQEALIQEPQKAEAAEAAFGNGPVKISGQAQVSLGLTPDDVVWKQANFDLIEREWRLNSEAGYNRRFNTYDPRVYDSLKLNLDSDNSEGFSFHGNIAVDPWSFTGRGPKMTVGSTAGGDTAQIELKYWSNTGYTINQTIPTTQGNSFSLPELKVKDDSTSTDISFITDGWASGTRTFTIPEVKIQGEFQPLRELWLDYKQPDLSLRIFPIAYQDQALTSDDPLKLSNNHIWWEDSPWIRQWTPGFYNAAATPRVDFTKGWWDNSLSSFTRDSSGQRLTALRGFNFNLSPQWNTTLDFSLASPKNLWQDYDSVDNIISALRLKTNLLDNLSVGFTSTTRTGFNLEQDNATDARNYVGAVDLRYEIMDGLLASLESAYSKSDNDLTYRDYRTEARGNAYYFSLVGQYPFENIMDLKYGYDEIGFDENDKNGFLVKGRFFAARMDEEFDPSLSTYRRTRDDAFWSRHIHFRKPMVYHNAGISGSTLKWEDINPFSIGNGIDTGRQVLGLRLETIWQDRLSNLFDLRNVHHTNHKYIETVVRDEIEYKPTPQLTAKGLAIYQDMPKTTAGKDPFRFNAETNLYYDNTAVLDEKDPSLKTGSVGLEYAFFDWLSLNGIYERTNDYFLAYDNFPRKALTGHQRYYLYWEGDQQYRDTANFFNYPGLFPTPPYPWYNIFKAGLRLEPLEKLEIYLDYTRNEFKSAGQIDDNINHIGLEFSYLPFETLGFYFKYVYSRWNDLYLMTQGYDKYYLGHHNVFTELRYFPSVDDELALQYGEAAIPLGTSSFDPYGGSLPTLDTAHIFRIYYRRKF